LSSLASPRLRSPKTLSIPEAGWRYYRLGRNASYEAAKRGYIPVIKIGTRRMRVSVALMERKLVEFGTNEPNDALRRQVV
jgi:hypothetical protein